MFDRLFTYPHTRARHRAGPLVNERLAYLAHLANAGISHISLRTAADYILLVVDQLGLAHRSGETISREEIQRVATLWADRPAGSCHRKGGLTSGSHFRFHATRWLDFLGRLEQQPRLLSPYAEQIAAFADYLRNERGLSSQTITKVCQFVERFLGHLHTCGSLCEITLTRIDEILRDMITAGSLARVTILNYVNILRSFFRYTEMRGWCRKGLAAGIRGPRIFAQESLPAGPSWNQVQQLLATSKGDRPSNIRDHAILMLLASYGLRASEVTGLRLEDFDWERELLSVRCSKARRTRTYPLSRPVGDAVLRYLKEVRPRSVHRNMFLCIYPPIRPLGEMWPIVGKRLRSLGVSLRHHGPHSIRHACATHLLAQGLSLKEIGDYLGHRNPDSTRIYAKVDLVGLRRVADLDLGGLL